MIDEIKKFFSGRDAKCAKVDDDAVKLKEFHDEVSQLEAKYVVEMDEDLAKIQASVQALETESNAKNRRGALFAIGRYVRVPLWFEGYHHFPRQSGLWSSPFPHSPAPDSEYQKRLDIVREAAFGALRKLNSMYGIVGAGWSIVSERESAAGESALVFENGKMRKFVDRVLVDGKMTTFVNVVSVVGK